MSVIDNYKKLLENIRTSCTKYNRNFKDISIVAVSKQHSAEKIKTLADIGHKSFGENRLEEVISKWKLLNKKKLQLRFIGPLQSNKVKEIVKIFDVIETLDTESSAKKLSILKTKNLKMPEIFIQINIGEEAQKRGVSPKNFSSFLNMCKYDYGLEISGAMCMPPFNKDPCKYFDNMLNICKEENLRNISMGMSNDFHEAIKYGTTSIRVGTIIFGNRNK